MKLKDILYKNYSDLKSQEKRFYTLNQEKFEIDMCEKCSFIDSTYELFWDCNYNLPDKWYAYVNFVAKNMGVLINVTYRKMGRIKA